MPALAAYVQRRFGVRTQLRERLLVVTAAGVDLEANPNRLSVLFVNHGGIYGTVTSLRPGAIDQGARLDGSGGAVVSDVETDGEGVGLLFRLFSSGANINVSIWETIALDTVEV